jgi:nucleoside-diphosphate kinase
MEQTLVVVKPDGVMRGLAGSILARFEQIGLKLVAAKLLTATDDLAEQHYPADRPELWKGIGQKTLDHYQDVGEDPEKSMGTADPHEIGKQVRVWLLNYLKEGPVFAFVLEGPHAVELVRKITGHTLPLKAALNKDEPKKTSAKKSVTKKVVAKKVVTKKKVVAKKTEA